MAVGETAILLTGPSGAGKSDMALRLIDQGAVLVADDYIEIESRDGEVYGRAPAAIKGMMEVRGLGLAKLPYRAEPVPIRLVVRLVAAADIARLPEPLDETLLGQRIPAVALHAFEASACAKVKLALAAACGYVEMIKAEDA